MGCEVHSAICLLCWKSKLVVIFVKDGDTEIRYHFLELKIRLREISEDILKGVFYWNFDGLKFSNPDYLLYICLAPRNSGILHVVI